MAKTTPTPSTSRLDKNDPTVIQMTNNCFWKIVWARFCQTSSEDGHRSPKVAEFSAEVHMDGLHVATLNKLCILDTRRQDDSEPVVQIGSLYTDTYSARTGKTQRIYVATFWPGANENPEQDKQRENFATRVVTAVQTFIKNMKDKAEERDAKRSQQNPVLQGLMNIGNEIRSFNTKRS